MLVLNKFYEMASKHILKEPSLKLHENSPAPSVMVHYKNNALLQSEGRKRVCSPPTPKRSARFTFPLTKQAQSVSRKNYGQKMESAYSFQDTSLAYIEKHFLVIEEIGSGSFSKVFKVQDKIDGQFYAIKKANRKFRSQSDKKRRLNEVEKHERLPKHQNCVELHKAWEEDGVLYMQLELCSSNLDAYALKNPSIPERLVWKFLIDLLLGVKNLHDNDLIHLDIKPENIFLTSNFVSKLGDFGLALDASNADQTECDHDEGDCKYLAAEVLQGHYTKAADIFSSGLTILELACNLDLPKNGELWHQLRKGDIPHELVKKLSPELTTVIKAMMQPDFKSRPTVDAILAMEPVKTALMKRQCELKKISQDAHSHEKNISKSIASADLLGYNRFSESSKPKKYSSLSEFAMTTGDELQELNDSVLKIANVASVSLSEINEFAGKLDSPKRKYFPSRANLSKKFRQLDFSSPSCANEKSVSTDSKLARNLQMDFEDL